MREQQQQAGSGSGSSSNQAAAAAASGSSRQHPEAWAIVTSTGWAMGWHEAASAQAEPHVLVGKMMQGQIMRPVDCHHTLDLRLWR
jgi:hypothetical protein